MTAIQRGELGAEAVLHTSERIEQAALELFFDRGFKATTMREIALACGLTPGALYNHFVSKDALLEKIMLDVHRDLMESIGGAVAAAGDDPHDQLRAYVFSHSLFHTRSLREAHVGNREIGSLRDEARNEVVRLRRDSSGQLRGIIERGKSAGYFDVEDVGIATNLILTMAVSIATWFRPGGRLTGEEVSDATAEMALRMVGGDGRR